MTETKRKCPHCEEMRDADEFRNGGWCTRCQNTKPRPPNKSRILRNRARHRAKQALATKYRDEYNQLTDLFLAEAWQQADRLESDPSVDLPDAPTVLLAPGRRFAEIPAMALVRKVAVR